MPRQDYDRFCKTFCSGKGYILFCRERRTCDLAFARVCEMKKTLVDSNLCPWTDCSTGVWIDVFPADGIEDDFRKAKEHIEKAVVLWRLSLQIRRSKCDISSLPGFYMKIKHILRKLIYSRQEVVDEHIKMCRAVEYGKTKYYSNIAYLGYGMKECHRTAVFDEVILKKFENEDFFIMKGYDEALTEKYGDYMKLPPKEERIPRHDSINKYYWK